MFAIETEAAMRAKSIELMEKIKEYTIFPEMHVTTVLTQNSGLI